MPKYQIVLARLVSQVVAVDVEAATPTEATRLAFKIESERELDWEIDYDATPFDLRVACDPEECELGDPDSPELTGNLGA